ncbi:MAG: hypothetical protein AAGF29_00250 [Pseudomonadota bacterium]
MKSFIAIAAAALLAGCNTTSGNQTVTVPANANAKPQGKYRISVSTNSGIMMRGADGSVSKLLVGAIYEPGITFKVAKERREQQLSVLRSAMKTRCAATGGTYGQGESIKFQKGAWTIATVCSPR